MGVNNNHKVTRAKKTPGYTGGGLLLDVIKDLNETDVLLGRGTGPSEHKGNREFRYLIAKRTNEFNSTDNRPTKSRIAEQTVRDVKAKDGRFLRRLEKSEYRFISDKTSTPELDDVLYIQVDDVTAVLKTKQAFRYCSRAATTTTTPHAAPVSPSTIASVIPSRINDPVVAASKVQQDGNKSLLAMPASLRQVVLYEQLKVAEMEIKSAAILRRMWQNEILAQQQEQQARLVASSLLVPRNYYSSLGPAAHRPDQNISTLLANKNGADPAPLSPLLMSRWEEEMMLRTSPMPTPQRSASLLAAGDGRGAGGHRPGADLLLSLLDQQARSSAEARMKRGCAPAGGRFNLPGISLQPRLSTAAPRAGNVHSGAAFYRLHDQQKGY
jgi:hypothetical protein